MRYKYCPRCGTKLPIDSQFCVKCGYKFDNNTDKNKVTAVKQPNQSRVQNKEASTNPHSHHYGRWIIAVFIILVVCFGAYSTYHHIVNPPVKPLTRTEATKKVNNIWTCTQNRVNYNKNYLFNNHVPMSAYFISGANNKSYKDIRKVFTPSHDDSKAQAYQNTKILSVTHNKNKHIYCVNDKMTMSFYSNKGNDYPMTVRLGFRFKPVHGKWLVSNIYSD